MKKSDKGGRFSKKTLSSAPSEPKKTRSAQIYTLHKAPVLPKDSGSELNKNIVAYAKKLSW